MTPSSTSDPTALVVMETWGWGEFGQCSQHRWTHSYTHHTHTCRYVFVCWLPPTDTPAHQVTARWSADLYLSATVLCVCVGGGMCTECVCVCSVDIMMLFSSDGSVMLAVITGV